MRYISLLILFLFSIQTIAQSEEYENDSIIIWNKNRKLTWDDFQNKVLEPPQFDAAGVSTGIEFLPKIISNKNINEITVFAVASKSESWVMNPSKELLDHEQIHFDITELFTRKLRKGISDYLKENKRYELDTIQEIYYKFQNKLDYIQDKYDKEIRKDWNDDKCNQKKWDKEIDSLLNVYKKYERNITIEDLKLK